MQTRTKESQRRLHSLILLTAFTSILLIVSTYAWFTTQKEVNISNLRGKVEVAEGLEISLDAARWTHEIDLGAEDVSLTKVPGTDGIKYGPYEDHTNNQPEEFLPVSTAAELASDTTKLTMLRGLYDGEKLGKPVATQNNESATNGGKSVDDEDYPGYYAFDLFVKNSSRQGTTAETLQLNSDSSAWVLHSKITETRTVDGVEKSVDFEGNADSGLQNCIRVAFARYGTGTLDSTAVPATDLTSSILSKTDDHKITAVSIWEPNSDKHAEYVVGNIKEFFDAEFTPNDKYLVETAADSGIYKKFFTFPLTKASLSADAGLANVYAWKTDTANFKEVKTLQTTARRAEATKDEVNIADTAAYNPYIAEGVQNLTDTTGANLTIPANSIIKFRIYIYIEGQDPDCITYASNGGGVEVNIGLTKDATVGSSDAYNSLSTPAAGGGEG